jgi:stage II sporulation protein R
MKRINLLTRIYAFLFCLLVLCLLLVIDTQKEGEELADKVIRLHILADSDREDAQRLKLLVCDAVLKELPCVLDGCKSPAEASALLQGNLNKIKQTAETVLKENNCFLPVSAALQNEIFDQRDYDGFSLPAGEYQALRLVIGEGKGHNWWCVVFPPLCLTSAIKDDETVLAVLDENELNFITTDKYVIKFKILDLIAQIKKKLDAI